MTVKNSKGQGAKSGLCVLEKDAYCVEVLHSRAGKLLSNLLRGNHSSHWVAIAHRLPKCDNIWTHTYTATLRCIQPHTPPYMHVLMRPTLWLKTPEVLATSSKPHLDLICNAQTSGCMYIAMREDRKTTRHFSPWTLTILRDTGKC